MLNFLMFIYCEVMLLLFFAITNTISNKNPTSYFIEGQDGHGRVRGSAGGHGPKKVENRWSSGRLDLLTQDNQTMKRRSCQIRQTCYLINSRTVWRQLWPVHTRHIVHAKKSHVKHVTTAFTPQSFSV